MSAKQVCCKQLTHFCQFVVELIQPSIKDRFLLSKGSHKLSALFVIFLKTFTENEEPNANDQDQVDKLVK